MVFIKLLRMIQISKALRKSTECVYAFKHILLADKTKMVQMHLQCKVLCDINVLTPQLLTVKRVLAPHYCQ